VANDKFHENDTFEEWASKQYKDSLELQAVTEVHKIYPNWNLEEIKEYIPRWLNRHAKHVRSVSNAHPDLDMGTIETFISDYIQICEKNRNIYIELFGSPPINMNQLSKWNSTIARISKIIYEHPGGGHIESPKYKPKDDLGHSSFYGFRTGDKTRKIRAEEQLGRDITIIRDDNKHRFETESDLLKELVFKGIEMYSLINKDTFTEGREILLSMERKRAEDKELSRIQREDDINSYLNIRLKRLESILDIKNVEDMKMSMTIFRDEIDEYLKENLTYFVGNMDMKILIKHLIMNNRDLDRILRKLEDNKLISRDYSDSILKNGTVLPVFEMVQKEDAK
jgi:hypothetical protein